MKNAVYVFLAGAQYFHRPPGRADENTGAYLIFLSVVETDENTYYFRRPA
jgi:hypothetical protein